MGTKIMSNENNYNFKKHGFCRIGGLAQQLQTLRELIIIPLKHHNVYERFNIKPPRGVLFHGPPGTGKTLVAAALAEECKKDFNGMVSFYNRKGADILDMWVGESERKLRELFDQALQTRPSIIFFDELDGLAPIRSSRQDQIHTSIVAMLLAMMDGLDSKPGLVVIGATNRLDSIDPALRRPGRFDKELYFPLPDVNARVEILKVHIHTWPWSSLLSAEFLIELAEATVGFCGADLQALCVEAVMCCIRRFHPKIHSNLGKFKINPKNLKVSNSDFLSAKEIFVPASSRIRSPLKQLNAVIRPLLQSQLTTILNRMRETWPHFFDRNYRFKTGTERYSGRLLITGAEEQGHTNYVAPAILHHLEHLPCHLVDLQTMHESGIRAAEETFIQIVNMSKQCAPAVLYVPRMDLWWGVVHQTTRSVFMSLINEIDPAMPLLLLFTCSDDVPQQIYEYLKMRNSIVTAMRHPVRAEREAFFSPLLLGKALAPPQNTLIGTKPENEPQYADDLIDHNQMGLVRNALRYSRRIRMQDVEYTPSSSDDNHQKGMKRRRDMNYEPTESNQLSTKKKKNAYFQYDDSSSKSSTPVIVPRKKEEKRHVSVATDTKHCRGNKIITPSVNLKSAAVRTAEEVIDSMISFDRHSFESDENIDKHFLTYKPHMLALLRRIVDVSTISCTIANLELLYDRINFYINRYASDWNRNKLVQDINRCVEDFEKEMRNNILES